MKLYIGGKEFSGGWNFGPIGTTNQSVRTLIEKIIKFCDKGFYEAPELNSKFLEASLLNLDISKAMHFLNWKPVLTFDETVKMTVDGYLFENNQDAYSAIIEQINEYCELAKERNSDWVK